ncbi:MAG: ATP synthase F1 subunit delta [Thermodesulfobacteriota bacterium]|nr:ATP synthase F1 subunit delta [Thermodesulfobacteriota bacterium]
MIATIVPRRYARALFAVGREKGDAEIEAYGKDLAGIGEVLAGAPELMKVFRNPIFSNADKKAVVDKILDKLSPNPTIKNFCYLLADKNRLDCLPEINVYFGVLLDEAQGLVRGEFITAVELDGAKQDDLKKKLEDQLKSKLVLDFAADPAILGGVVLKVGDKVLDASLRAQLNILKENIKRGE